MIEYRKFAQPTGRLLMIGFGSVGQGILPLLLRHLEISREQITVYAADEGGRGVAEEHGVALHAVPLTRDNYRAILADHLCEGDFLLNLSYDVSSLALIDWCQQNGALYLDACIEPWPGGHKDKTASPSSRSNYAYREKALSYRRRYNHEPTAIVNQGVNPGLVSQFTKRALLSIARDTGLEVEEPSDRVGWARLARQLGIKVIHVAERDTQQSSKRKLPEEFINTWSIDAFVGEGSQPAELGWGSHERHFPPDGERHDSGSQAAIYLNRPGAGTRVRSWTPLTGPYHGFLITHGESVSIADYYSVTEGGRVVYRPTVHYAYHPCDDAVLSLHELAGRNWQQQPRQRLLTNDIVRGMDELGVLLMGHAKGAYWYGSQLSIHEARALCPHNNATSLQTAAGCLGGVIWALNHPDRGVVEPDELCHEEILEVAEPYLGEMVGVYTDWTPLTDRELLFPEDLDHDDPWQFKNFRVT
jgi:homospermidine synthase